MRAHVSFVDGKSPRLAGAVCAAALLVAGGCASGRPGGLGGRKGTPWTILCLELSGPDRLRQVEQFAETLRRTPEIRSDDVSVQDESDGFARLYYGTYYRRADRKTGKRPIPVNMRHDLDYLKQLGDASGRRYFLRAIPVRAPTPDVGNPAWSLSTVDAEYSLQVAVFEPTDDFWEYKQAAAEFCGFLRERGYESYYYHGQACSVVTVGAFGPEALITGLDGRTYYSREVLALQREELLKHNLLNGSVYKIRNEEGVAVPVPSRLVEVPRRSGDELP
jgi:hypothetical protein